MRLGVAVSAAADWVRRHAAGLPGFRGAYVSGSAAGQPADAELAPWSDVDVTVVIEGDPPPRPGKLRHGGALIEASIQPWAQLADPEVVLGSYHLAYALNAGTILADPTGRLGELHEHVAARFAEPGWVLRRCEQVRAKIEAGLDALDPAAPTHERLMGWLFSTGVTSLLPLVAAGRNPTVRLRYPAARAVLAEHGQAGAYPALLSVLGCAAMAADRVRLHLDALAGTFDSTAALPATHSGGLPYRSDISPAARPVAIDGSRALVDAGDHREAVFWIAVTFARCHAILAADSPALAAALRPALDAIATDLGVANPAALPGRVARVRAYLPELWQVCERIRTG